jgi:hypothetical protein
VASPRPQVEIAEEEPEDVAVRRYMKAVMQSGVINKVRASPGSGGGGRRPRSAPQRRRPARRACGAAAG